MARVTNTYFDRLSLDNVSDGSGDYTPIVISPANKFSIRFPDNSLYGHGGPCEDINLTITLQIEEGK